MTAGMRERGGGQVGGEEAWGGADPAGGRATTQAGAGGGRVMWFHRRGLDGPERRNVRRDRGARRGGGSCCSKGRLRCTEIRERRTTRRSADAIWAGRKVRVRRGCGPISPDITLVQGPGLMRRGTALGEECLDKIDRFLASDLGGIRVANVVPCGRPGDNLHSAGAVQNDGQPRPGGEKCRGKKARAGGAVLSGAFSTGCIEPTGFWGSIHRPRAPAWATDKSKYMDEEGEGFHPGRGGTWDTHERLSAIPKGAEASPPQITDVPCRDCGSASEGRGSTPSPSPVRTKSSAG